MVLLPSANDVRIRPMLAHVSLPGVGEGVLDLEREPVDRRDRLLPERTEPVVAGCSSSGAFQLIASEVIAEVLSS